MFRRAVLAPRVNNKLKFRDEFSKRYLRYIKKEKKDDGSAFLFSLLLSSRASPSWLPDARAVFYYYILARL
jgi:hypothetical protein